MNPERLQHALRSLAVATAGLSPRLLRCLMAGENEVVAATKMCVHVTLEVVRLRALHRRSRYPLQNC